MRQPEICYLGSGVDGDPLTRWLRTRCQWSRIPLDILYASSHDHVSIERSRTRRQSVVLEQLIDDCLHLLMAVAAYQWALREMGRAFGEGTRHELHLRNVALREQENALVIRVCRFDDDSKRQVSLRSALVSVRSQLVESDARTLDADLKKFRVRINPLKVRVRNQLVAHLNDGSVQPHDATSVSFGELGEERDITRIQSCTRSIVELTDRIAGASITYSLRSGSMESPIDLRELVGLTHFP